MMMKMDAGIDGTDYDDEDMFWPLVRMQVMMLMLMQMMQKARRQRSLAASTAQPSTHSSNTADCQVLSTRPELSTSSAIRAEP